MLESVVKSTSTETLSDFIGSGFLRAGAGGVVCVSGVGAELLAGVAEEAVPVANGAESEFVASGAEAWAVVTWDGAPAAETAAFVALALSISAMRC